jgi:hypothetical protein
MVEVNGPMLQRFFLEVRAFDFRKVIVEGMQPEQRLAFDSGDPFLARVEKCAD